MSTILKSLKKLEQEKEATRYAVHAGPGSTAVSGGPARWNKSTWIRRGIVVLLILGLGSTSLYFYRQTQRQPDMAELTPKASPPPVEQIAKGTIKTKKQPSPGRTGSPQPSVPRVNQPLKTENQDRRPDGAAALQSSPANRQAEPSTSTVSPLKRPSSASEPALEPTLTPAEQPAPPVRLPRRRQPVRPESQPATTRSQDTVRPAPQKSVQPSDTYDSARPLTDGRLKIHAIVWSENKEDRMAVVNTQILHEGDTVSGFSIVSIRPDDVVVRGEGGELHRVLFGRP